MHQRLFQWIEDVRRQIVKSPAVPGCKAAQPALQRQRLITNTAYPILRLPSPTPLDANARPHGVVHSKAKDVSGGRGLEKRLCDRIAEEKVEIRAGRAKVGSWRERQVDLQVSGEKEYAVDARLKWQVEQVDGCEFVCKQCGPVAEKVGNVSAVRDAKSEIDVRPSVSSADSRGADFGTRDHTPVGARLLQETLAYPPAVLDREHRPIVSMVSR